MGALMDNFDTIDKFCGKITALFLPYLRENIPEKEWLRFQGKIEECFREFAGVYFSEKPGRALDLPAMTDTMRKLSVRRSILQGGLNRSSSRGFLL